MDGEYCVQAADGLAELGFPGHMTQRHISTQCGFLKLLVALDKMLFPIQKY